MNFWTNETGVPARAPRAPRADRDAAQSVTMIMVQTPNGAAMRVPVRRIIRDNNVVPLGPAVQRKPSPVQQGIMIMLGDKVAAAAPTR